MNLYEQYANRIQSLRDAAGRTGDLPAFDVTPVIRYFAHSPQDVWTFQTDFPNLAPPFEEYVCFGRWPSKWWIPATATTPAHWESMSLRDMGAHFLSRRRPEGGWYVQVGVFLTPALPLDVGLTFYEVSATGAATPIAPDGGPVPPSASPGLVWVMDGNSPLVQRAQANAVSVVEQANFRSMIVNPMLLATCFLHCKNVTAREVHISAKDRRRAEKRGQRRYTWHLLEIEPMRRTLDQTGAAGTALQQRLHICRGHFKDYRDGRGLFGKYTGLYWWESQVRGSVEAGVADKTYRVQVPAGAARTGETR